MVADCNAGSSSSSLAAASVVKKDIHVNVQLKYQNARDIFRVIREFALTVVFLRREIKKSH